MKKLLIALLVAVALSSCQQQAVYIDGQQVARVEFKTHSSYQLRLMPLNDAQRFVDSVGAIKYTIIVDGVTVSSK